MKLLKVFNPKEVKKKKMKTEQKKPEKQRWRDIVDFNLILFIIPITFSSSIISDYKSDIVRLGEQKQDLTTCCL